MSLAAALLAWGLGCGAPTARHQEVVWPGAPYDLDRGLESRSISFENPTGRRGAGGAEASPLGAGRKGHPAELMQPGSSVTLADIEGNGTIRHLWLTTVNVPAVLRGFTLRAYWDGQEHPSVESPLGDFAGFAHGKVVAYQSAVHAVGENAAMNVYLPMPFVRGARLTLTNDGPYAAPVFYQVDYTLGDRHPDDVGRLHVLFRRENPTGLGQDFELLPERHGRGVFVGAVIGVRVLGPGWWGEGEVKFYLDGDQTLATIVGTGSEDYVGLSFGLQETPYLYQGASLFQEDFVSMYRWHLPDPIFWNRSCRVTMQQIGHRGESLRWEDYPGQLFERQDDWSTATFWYEPVPSEPLPPMPGAEERLRDIWPHTQAPWQQLIEQATEPASESASPSP